MRNSRLVVGISHFCGRFDERIFLSSKKQKSVPFLLITRISSRLSRLSKLSLDHPNYPSTTRTIPRLSRLSQLSLDYPDYPDYYPPISLDYPNYPPPPKYLLSTHYPAIPRPSQLSPNHPNYPATIPTTIH